MRDGADAVGAAAAGAHADATLLAGLDHLGGSPARLRDVEEDEVGLHLRGIAFDALDVGKAGREAVGVVVVLGEAVPVILERVERGGSDHARLAHRAAQHLLLAPGFLDELLGARQRRADGSAQALGVVDPEGVHTGAVVAGLDAGLHGGIAEACAIHVHGQARAARDLGDALHGGQRPYRAEARVGRVLDRHQPRARGVAAVGIADRGLNLFAGEHPVGTVEHADHDAGIGGRAAGFGIDDVRGLVGDDLVTQAAMDSDGDLVAHGAARQEDRIFLAQELADPLAQPLDGGVFVFLLVADFGFGHGFAHAGGGLGFGVAVKVDKTILHGVSYSPASP